ncbi:hypothetical protein C8J56DRAFT_1060053 [Mycena floridula]|nr:hypothetical protein C8J56DRAFT_1060053 [Mycena floridula]
MDLEKISIVKETTLDSPSSPVPSSDDDDDASTTQMGDNIMRSLSPPALTVVPAADSSAITPSSPEERIYKLMDTNLKRVKYWHNKYEDLTHEANQMRQELERTSHHSASPKRHRKESSTTSSSEDSRAPTCDKEIQNKIDLRLNPFSEDDLKHEIAYSYGQPPSSLVAQGVIKRLYAEAVSTSPHLQTPAMRCILKDGYVQTHRPSPIIEKTPITSTLPVMHYQLGGAKPGFTIALIDASPAPKSLTYYMHETEAAAFFIYRARSDQLYIGCEVYQNLNHQWCISLRQVRGLLAAHATAPTRTKENARVHHKYFFIFATLLGIQGKYAMCLQQLRLAHPHYQSIDFKPVPLCIAPGIELTMSIVVEHIFHCGLTIARADDGYPYGCRFIEIFSNKLGGNNEEINPGPNHVYNHEWVSAKQDSDILVSSGIPTGYPGDPIYTAIEHVVPFADRGVNPIKGQTSAKSKNHCSGHAKTSGRIQSQVNQATSQLNSVSFRNSVPAFVDPRYTPGFGGGVTYPPIPTFPPSGFVGQFMTPSTSAGPSVMNRASSSSLIDAVMGDSVMVFDDLIRDDAYGSDDGHADVFTDVKSVLTLNEGICDPVT